MKIHDVSMRLKPGMLHWPNETAPGFEWETQLARGDVANVSRWTLGAHSGTHVDAPSHFIPGAGDLDSISLNQLVGPARVVDLTGLDGPIGGRDVKAAHLNGASRVLFRTSNSLARLDSAEFDESYVAIAPDGAQALLEVGVRTVGIDYLSVECFDQKDFRTHHLLLGQGVAVIEGLDLRAVEEGSYFLSCLPLRLTGAEAAPARAVLIEGIRADAGG